MEWFFLIVITICLFDIEDKLRKLMRKNASTCKNAKHLILNDYKERTVSITINNDNIENAYLFQPTTRTTGVNFFRR